MLDMSPLGWIVVGFLAGWLSGMVVRGPAARGCLPNILVGILGGILGGILARALHLGDAQGFTGALVVAFLGAVLVRLLLDATRPRRERW